MSLSRDEEWILPQVTAINTNLSEAVMASVMF